MANDLVFDAWGFMPAAFKEAGYFDPGAKFAIVYSDTKDQAFVVNNVLKPAFAAIGHPALDTAAIPGLQGFQTFGDAQSQCQSHFLRFRSQGISHIMFTTPEGPFACENNAESQGYRPRYAYTTSSGPVIPLQPAEQQLRSIMLRWTLITTSGSKASGPSTGNASRDLCNKIYAGQPINVSLTSIYRYCDALFLLQAGYRRAPDMTNTGFVAGLESLGDTLLATEGLGNARFGTGKNWGAASYAMAAWNAEKRQFEFTTKPTPIPGA